MTELPQPSPNAAKSAVSSHTSPKPKPIIPFFAVIRVLSTVRWVGEEAEFLLGGVPTRVRMAPDRAQQLQGQPLEEGQVYSLALWFRTLEGQVQALELAGIKPLKDQNPAEALDVSPTCTLATRLKAVFPEDGYFDVQVETNPAGQLQQPFDIRVWAAPDFIARLPRLEKTLIVYGEYQPQTGRLVAQHRRKTRVGQPEVGQQEHHGSEQNNKSV